MANCQSCGDHVESSDKYKLVSQGYTCLCVTCYSDIEETISYEGHNYDEEPHGV